MPIEPRGVNLGTQGNRARGQRFGPQKLGTHGGRTPGRTPARKGRRGGGFDGAPAPAPVPAPAPHWHRCQFPALNPTWASRNGTQNPSPRASSAPFQCVRCQSSPAVATGSWSPSCCCLPHSHDTREHFRSDRCSQGVLKLPPPLTLHTQLGVHWYWGREELELPQSRCVSGGG